MIRTHDMMGRPVTLSYPPRRIVSLVPSQTELLYDLGLDDAVVGITKFCVHPEPWFRQKTRVGGTKTVHLDRVAMLQPDLILANREENVREQIEALEQVAPVWVSDINNLETALEMIRSVGQLTGKAAIADPMAAAIQGGFSRLAAQSRVPLRVAYGIWRDPWMWAGGDTFISDLIVRMGWENVLRDRSRYPTVSLEELSTLAPDCILLSSEPFPFKQKHMKEVQQVLPATRVQLVDGEMFSWYGSRLLRAVDYLEGLMVG